jgi:micrococcal nuclease
MAGYPAHGTLVAARFVRIVDGDTIKVDLGGSEVTVRYIGMDTPETVRPGTPVQWMGEEAAAANEGLLERGGGTVYLEKDVSETDRYGRLLRYVWVRTDGADLLVNLELLRLGVAQVATFPPDVKDIDPWFLDAERAAREAGIGLWGATPAPAETAAPLLGGARLVVCGGVRNAPGDDNANLNGEYAVVCNTGTAAADLTGWRLTDDGARHTYTFPRFTLAAGARVTLFSGSGNDSASALYWRSDGAIWNNDGDCAHLLTPAGAEVSARCL